MSIKYLEIREKVITYVEKAAGRAAGLLDAPATSACGSPASPNLLACTPSSTQYDLLEPEDIAIVDLDGNLVDGRRSPTSEVPMHTLILQAPARGRGIVHTHGKAVMTFATLGWTLPPILTGLVRGDRRRRVHLAVLAARDRPDVHLHQAGARRPRRDLPAAPRPAGHRRRPRARVPHRVGRRGRLRGLPGRPRSSARCPSCPPAQVEWIASYWRAQFPGAPSRCRHPSRVPAPESAGRMSGYVVGADIGIVGAEGGPGAPRPRGRRGRRARLPHAPSAPGLGRERPRGLVSRRWPRRCPRCWRAAGVAAAEVDALCLVGQRDVAVLLDEAGARPRRRASTGPTGATRRRPRDLYDGLGRAG